jgi:hypothetical protein
LRELKKVNALKGQGHSSMSGDQLDLFGYPEPVYSDDVKAILNNNMTVYEMVSEYPIEGQLPGYLRFESLAQANAEVSQVAVRALFDSIAIGLNKKFCGTERRGRKARALQEGGSGLYDLQQPA